MRNFVSTLVCNVHTSNRDIARVEYCTVLYKGANVPTASRLCYYSECASRCSFSMTPKRFSRGHWPLRNCRNFSYKMCSYEITNCPRQNDFSGVIAPPKQFQRGHWQRWNDFSGVNDPAEISNRRFGPTTFLKREYPVKLFHREISPYHIFKQKKVGKF
jgi:hypothetical protein